MAQQFFDLSYCFDNLPSDVTVLDRKVASRRKLGGDTTGTVTHAIRSKPLLILSCSTTVLTYTAPNHAPSGLGPQIFIKSFQFVNLINALAGEISHLEVPDPG
jgi:hypothetical protein